MSTTLSPLNTYHLDIPGRTIFSFTAPDLATAQSAAQSLATIIHETLQLVALGNQGEVPTAYAPGAQGGNVATPSGIARSPQ